MKKKTTAFGILLAISTLVSCDRDEKSDERENTRALCGDGLDNDGDGAIDCDDEDCRTRESCATRERAPDVSGLPIPDADEVEQPTGAPDNLEVLDWAGFNAALSYTFDDSHDSHLEHYAALHEMGIRATFFVNNATVTDTDAWKKVAEDGHELGNHTAHHCHNNLVKCAFGDALESQDAEIETCSEMITEVLDQPGVWSMAAPYGEQLWNSYAEDYVLLNRTVTSGLIAPNDGRDPLSLPAVMPPGRATSESLIEEIDLADEASAWLIFCFHAILPTVGNPGNGVDIDAITQSIGHAQDADDIWVDSMINIGAYWLGQSILDGTTPKRDGDNTIWTWELPDHFPSGKYLRIVVDGGVLSQNGLEIPWSPHGYYEISLDEGELTLML